ncbi:hypothetical protein Tco_1091402, partial [Tanacetum coccineum]
VRLSYPAVQQLWTLYLGKQKIVSGKIKKGTFVWLLSTRVAVGFAGQLTGSKRLLLHLGEEECP